VLFNGRKAEQFFQRFVGELADIETRVMPSTSPALARKGKVAEWRRVLAGFVPGG